MTEHVDFLPATGHHLPLFVYDPLTWLLGAASLHRRLVEEAGLTPGMRVLEVGCGTGSLTRLAARTGAHVTGLDPDLRVLARAASKTSGLGVQLDRGYAERLPYADGSFDRVLSAFMYHHLKPEAREAMLSEVWRVLTSGGRLHLVDFERLVSPPLTRTGSRRTPFGRVAFFRT
jgi:ubiquinone/menaquinone biosynthesis C-methylase UbiE